jgi:hypothetical protein
MKKIHFKTSLEAVDWIADYAKDEGHFEVLREQLNFNFIYTGRYFLEMNEQESEGEIVMNGRKR